MPKREVLFAYVFPIVAVLAPFLLYLRTLAPTYIPIDSAEFALCMKYWGVCHPPGFPLYIALGHFFVKFFPIGTLIYRANLLSAIYGALTVGVVYLVLRQLKVNAYVSLLLSFLFAVSSVFWEFAIAADVFSFSTFLIALTFLFVFAKKPYLAFLTLGLTSSHFYITAVLWPFVYWYFWGFKLRLREGLLAGIIFTFGFFPQALMWWRIGENPPVNWGHAKGFSGFWYFIRRQEFGSIFLLANPALTFNLLKLFKNFYHYFVELFANFAGILPVIAFIGAIFNFGREVKLLLGSYLVLIFVQLTLLSTIDPSGADNPFQLNKFYLSSFVLVVFLAGVALEYFSHKFFEREWHVVTLLTLLTLVYFAANFKTHDYSKNYFSENMVNDAMSELPGNSVGITVSHVMYFGGRYEQEVNGKYGGVDLLYFPNEKNRDGESYRPQLFARPVDTALRDKVLKGKQAGNAENYVLGTISRNLDRDIYILQGSFEEGFFRYLDPYKVPYGLWWRVTPNLVQKASMGAPSALFDAFKNIGVRADTLELKQQKLDAATYAISYFSQGLFLASGGKWEEALNFMDRSLGVNRVDSIATQKDLIAKVRELDHKRTDYLQSKDQDKLNELGNGYFNLQYFSACRDLYLQMIDFDKSAQNYNNLASCQASLGLVSEARENYQQALLLDPKLDLAKRGLETLQN